MRLTLRTIYDQLTKPVQDESIKASKKAEDKIKEIENDFNKLQQKLRGV